MNVGLYTSITGKMAREQNQEIIARNLANVNTIGFKKNFPIFSTFLKDAGSVGGAELSKVGIDYGQGNLQPTGNTLDIAIHGNGFFTMETEKGLKYTRKGHFMLDKDRQIINEQGWRLSGIGGPLQLPKDAKDIQIDAKGGIIVDGAKIGEIKITDFHDKDKEDLKEAGASSFVSSSGKEGVDSTDYEIQQGFLEGSNVSVVTEMVNLIVNMRSFDSNNKVTNTVDDTLQQLIRTANSTTS